jgi:hypothetical protein
VHDGTIIVRAKIIAIADVLLELRRHARLDVLPVDRHKLVAILTALFVPKADRMSDFMNRVSETAARPEANRLATSAHAD